jgi:hypothetical protein
MLIILANREESLLGCAAAGSKVEGDDRMTLETGGWANISTFPSFFCVSPFSLVSLFVSILSPFPFWFMLLLVVMEGEWSCWYGLRIQLAIHGGDRVARARKNF